MLRVFAAVIAIWSATVTAQQPQQVAPVSTSDIGNQQSLDMFYSGIGIPLQIIPQLNQTNSSNPITLSIVLGNLKQFTMRPQCLQSINEMINDQRNLTNMTDEAWQRYMYRNIYVGLDVLQFFYEKSIRDMTQILVTEQNNGSVRLAGFDANVFQNKSKYAFGVIIDAFRDIYDDIEVYYQDPNSFQGIAYFFEKAREMLTSNSTGTFSNSTEFAQSQVTPASSDFINQTHLPTNPTTGQHNGGNYYKK